MANYLYLGCDFTKPSGSLREKKKKDIREKKRKKISKRKDSQTNIKGCLQIPE